MRLKLVLLTVMLMAAVSAAHAEDQLRVGLVLPLSGPVADMARYALEGFRLGVAGTKIEVFSEDDQFDPKRSVEAFQKLLDHEHINVAVALGSGPSNAVAPVAESKGVVFLPLAGDPNVSKGRPHVIRTRISGQAEGRAIAAAMKRSGVKKVAVICAANEYPISVCSGLREGLGGMIVRNDEVLPQENDFRSIITTLRREQPDAVFMGLMPGKISAFAKQFRQLGLTQSLWSTAWLYSDVEVRSSNGALVGARLMAPPLEGKAIELLQSKIGGGSLMLYAAQFYELGRMLASCDQKSGDLLACLKAIHGFDGSLGTIDFAVEDGDQFLGYPFVLQEATAEGFVRARQ
jgi:ABC-type branched-subunit amino acid transport system substrate-binding protein